MLQISLNPKNIIAVDVYLENRKTRAYVGRLKEIKTAEQKPLRKFYAMY